MVNQQRSLPRLDGCVTFDADTVRVGGTRVPCHAEPGGLVAVLGDRLRPLTLGERALALSLGAQGLARAVWRLSGGNAALAHSIGEQAVVEAVALHLAGAANSAGLHAAVVAAGLHLGDAARAQALGAAIADELAASVEAHVPGGASEPGWTVLRIGADDLSEDPREELRDPAAVRAALVAALLARAGLPVPSGPADPVPLDPVPLDPTSAVAPTHPAPRFAAPPVPAPGGAPEATAPAGPRPGEGPRPLGAGPRTGAPLPVASTPAAPTAVPEPVVAATAPSRFPARSPSEEGRAAPQPVGAAGTSTTWPAPLPAPSSPRTGLGRGPLAAEAAGSRSPDLAGIDWQALPTLGWGPTRGPIPDDRSGSWGGAGGPADTARPCRTGACTAVPVEPTSGLSDLADDLLAVADRRGLR